MKFLKIIEPKILKRDNIAKTGNSAISVNAVKLARTAKIVKLSNSLKFKGIPSSSGIALGQYYLIENKLDTNLDNNFQKNGTNKKEKNNLSQIQKECDYFDQILENVKTELQKLIEKQTNDKFKIKNILESTYLILDDPILRDSIITEIKNGHTSSEAIVMVIELQKQFFKKSSDNIIREKVAELDEIKQLLISSAQSINIEKEIPDGAIVITKSVTTTDIIKLKDKNIKGLITEVGGIGSHSAILCRSFQIPQVIGVNNICESILKAKITKSNGIVVGADSKSNNKNRTPNPSLSYNIIIDGFNGEIIINPTVNSQKKYTKQINDIEKRRKKLGDLVTLPSMTLDGREIKLKANIDNLEDAKLAMINGADGVGLFRTESILLNSTKIPDEEEQFVIYNQIAESVFPNDITIRLFDFGYDKYNEGFAFKEDNPALGLRGIRYLLAKPIILKNQITAILRASKLRNIKIMVPMVSSLDEILTVKKHISDISSILTNRGLDHDKKIALGTMIETPSAAMISDILVDYCDFFSIGTNDLVQYVMAADRNNNYITESYDFFHPAVIRFIDLVIHNAHQKNKKVSVCGEIASHLLATKLLIGLGVDELSVVPNSLLETKKRIREIKSTDTIEFAELIMKTKSKSEIKQLLYKNY